MNGVAGGLLTWAFANSLIMITLCFLISLATRHFLTGVTLVLVTMCLALFVCLIGVGAGMAQKDFTLGVALPYVILAMVIAATWLLCMRTRAHKG